MRFRNTTSLQTDKMKYSKYSDRNFFKKRGLKLFYGELMLNFFWTGATEILKCMYTRITVYIFQCFVSAAKCLSVNFFYVLLFPTVDECTNEMRPEFHSTLLRSFRRGDSNCYTNMFVVATLYRS